MISVQTFGDAELRDVAKQLLRLVDESGFEPDIVISIAQGGTHVMEAIAVDLASRNIPTASVLCQRPGTQTKGTFRIKTWMTKLPLSLRNILRIVEHYVRALVDKFKIESDRNVTAISPDIFAVHNYSRILIIDDATDSGDTLSAVHLFIEQKFPASDIRFGVLTQTRRHMSKVPDYSLFKSVLIRFPWSNDFHAGDATSDNFIRSTLST